MHMRAHYLQHVPFEGLGSIGAWLNRSGYEVTATRLYDSDALPAVEEVDFLMVMGGPMSVNDEDDYPWLVAEKAFVAEVVRSGKPVLGICLGAQLIASALGGRVYPNAEKEIGWFPVQAAPESDGTCFTFPPSAEVFHWHGETFDPPPGATRLAYSDACRNQAFQLGDRVIGLQFHLETTPQSAKDIVANCRDELIPARYVQTEQQIQAAGSDLYEAINHLMGEVLSYLNRRRG